MLPAPPTAAFQPLLLRLFDFLTAHPEIRREVGQAAQALASWADGKDASLPSISTPKPKPPEPVDPPPAEKPKLTSLIPGDWQIPIRSSLESEFTQGFGRSTVDVDAAVGNPSEITARCRIKATTARALAESIDTGEPLSYESRGELMRQANELRNCRLWMLDSAPKSATVWRHLASAFDAAAATADLLGAWNAQPAAEYERKASDVLHLAAEGQAVLLNAVEAVGADRPDYDQIALFKIIRDEGDHCRIFIKRYLKRGDKADPTTGADVRKRVLELIDGLRKPVADPDKEITRVLKNLRFKLKPLETEPTGASVEWSRVFELVAVLVDDHRVPVSHVELRDLLLPALGVAPTEGIPVSAERALREASRYAAELAEPEDEPVERESYTAEVAEVRSLLSGKDLVFIGGQARRYAKAALEDAFGLREVNWIVTPEHTSTTVFEAPIARSNVAVVLLATRWSSHDYQNVKQFCIDHDKLFVKLPTGYHPNQVACEILEQIGDKLRAATA